MLSIVGSAVGAAFAAVPAIGGGAFTDSVQQGLGLAQGSAVWRALCVLALVASLCAAISASLLRAGDYATRISAAEVCYAELDGLHTQLEFTGMRLADAARELDLACSKVPYVVSGTSE